MKLGLLLVLFSLGACGGDAFEAASPLILAPTDAGEGGAVPVPDAAGGEIASPRDVLADPWPDDVEVSHVDRAVVDAVTEKSCEFGGTPATGCPCVNCYIFDGPSGSVDHIACCDGSGNPSDSSTDRLCNQGDFPTPHKGYCSSCSCQ